MGAKRRWGSHVALMQWLKLKQPHVTLPFMRDRFRNLTHVLDRPAYCERSSSTFQPPRESEIGQTKVTWIKTHAETDALLHTPRRLCDLKWKRNWSCKSLEFKCIYLFYFCWSRFKVNRLTTVVAVCLSYVLLSSDLGLFSYLSVCMCDQTSFSSEDE